MRKVLALFILLPLLAGMVLPVSAAVPANNTWFQTSTGMAAFPDNVNAFAFSPNYAANQTVFAATADGIYQSKDGGFTWSRAGLTGQHVNSILFYPISHAGSEPAMVAGTANGVYQAASGTLNWVDVTGDLPNADVLVVAFSPAGGLFAGTNGSGLFKTIFANGAATNWTLSGSLLSTTLTEINSLGFSPVFSTDHIMFAGSEMGDNWGGVYKSTDSGATWAAVNTGLPADVVHLDVHALVVSPNFDLDHTLFAGIGSGQGVFKSTDGGDSWVQLPDTLSLYIFSLAISPNFAQDGTLFAGEDGAGVFVSSTGGASWKAFNTGFAPADSITSLAIPPTQANQSFNVFAGTHLDGVWQLLYQNQTLFLPMVVR